MKKIFISLIVLFVAVILTIIFVPFGLAYGITYRILYLKDFSYVSKIIIRIAVCLDQLDNVVCGDFLDQTMTRAGKNFGLEDDTVSEILARNKDRNLTKLGMCIANILEKIDPGHLNKSLEENNL